MEAKKTFDAVAFVRKVRDANYEATKHMTPQQRVAWYRERARIAHNEYAELAQRKTDSKEPTLKE
jgi:hypothetical protein